MDQQIASQPQFRTDLVARTVEQDGARFVDVSDPETGSTFRLYAVEYAIACAMDGRRSVDELIDWARTEMGMESTPEDLQTVIAALDDLGYLVRSRGRKRRAGQPPAASSEQVAAPPAPAATRAPGAASKGPGDSFDARELVAMVQPRRRWLVPALVVTGLLALVYLLLSAPVERPPRRPAAAAVRSQVAVGDRAAAAAPAAVVELTGAPATAPLLRTAAPVFEVSVPDGIGVEFRAADGAELVREAVVLELAGHARWGRELAEAQRGAQRAEERLEYLRQRGRDAELAAVEKQLGERKARVAELERALELSLVRAPVAGTFRRQEARPATGGKVLVGRIEPGVQYTARFALARTAPLPAVDTVVRVASFAEPARASDCVVLEADVGVLTARCPSGLLQAGEQVELLR